MAYERLSGAKTVTLGGVDKKTGKKNPTQIEGYYVDREARTSKFKKDQNFYVFQTENGLEGIYGSTSIDQEMKKAKLGAMTKVVATGKTLDTGKGNPMKLFEVYQDKTNVIDAASALASAEEETITEDDDSNNEDLPEDEEEAPPVRTSRTATPPSSDARARVAALLNGNKSR